MAGEEEGIEALKQFINATHSTSDTGLWLVTKEQAKELLAEIGEREARMKPIKDKINDDISAYFTKDPQSRIIGGRDLEAYKTPVGIVTQRAPLDITSVLYPLSLPVQAIEELYSLFKLAGSEPHAKETQIYIWNLEKEAEDAIKKRHAPEEYTGMIEVLEPNGNVKYKIKQWRTPVSMPDYLTLT